MELEDRGCDTLYLIEVGLLTLHATSFWMLFFILSVKKPNILTAISHNNEDVMTNTNENQEDPPSP